MQLPSEDLKKFTSITQLQTKGLKKHFRELESGGSRKRKTFAGDDGDVNGDNKRMCDLVYQMDNDGESDDETPERDYNAVGVDDSSESDDSSSGDEVAVGTAETTALEMDFVAEKVVRPVPVQGEEPIIKEDVVKPLEKPIIPDKPAEPPKPATYVHVTRKPEIQEARLKLPILSEEQVIMEAISENAIVIIAGETGSGKTTQVPQFLYEAGYAKDQLIGITEPRRVAAISMAKRVGSEMSLGLDEVSYLIRFEGSTTDKTKIKFMTDGVLLKEIENDFLLSKYSVIILDEAHERSVYTDILLGLLSRIVPLRNKKGMPMKLIIMSATLRVSDFTENKKLFKIPPPVLKVDARQFPVTVHFNKRTDPDYVNEAYRKTVKIHTTLPDGGILIFLTGQQEVLQLVKRLRKAFPMQKKAVKGKASETKGGEKEADDEPERNVSDEDDEFDERPYKQKQKGSRSKSGPSIVLPKVNLDSYKLPGDDTEADLYECDDSDNETAMRSDDEDDMDEDEEQLAIESTSQPLWVLPLYSLLSSEHQARVFEPPPEGTRLCIVATNVAETSLTIPNIKYVIDAGRQKTRIYDKVTGVSAFVVTFTSKASAQQRAGRAGRTGPGHCYNLYSSAVYNDEFNEFSVPEIQKKPVDDLMLQMKCMGIDRVVNFPFPSPPDEVQLRVAEKKLQLLGALEDTKTEEEVAKVTKLGKAISVFPVAPRFGKMLALSHQHDLLPYTVCLVAALSVQEVFQESLNESNPDDGAEGESKSKKNAKLIEKRLKWVGQGNSLALGDPMVLMRSVGASEYANSQGKLIEFCSENGLRHKAIVEIRKLRVQLTNEINLHMPDLALFVDPEMKPPTDAQAKYLRQIILAGMNDNVARRCPPDETEDRTSKKSNKSVAYQTPEMEDPIYMSATSVLSRAPPEFVIYQEAYELQIPGKTPKMVMRGLTAVEAEWLPTYAPKQCSFEPVPDQKPFYDKATDQVMQKMHVTFGRSAWSLPDADMQLPFGAEACRQFGMFLLQGDVFEKLQPYQDKLLSTPSSITKAYNKIIPRVDAFIKALLRHQINSKQSLQTIWRKNPKCKFTLSHYTIYL